jgi:hypothetical protein
MLFADDNWLYLASFSSISPNFFKQKLP